MSMLLKVNQMTRRIHRDQPQEVSRVKEYPGTKDHAVLFVLLALRAS